MFVDVRRELDEFVKNDKDEIIMKEIKQPTARI